MKTITFWSMFLAMLWGRAIVSPGMGSTNHCPAQVAVETGNTLFPRPLGFTWVTSLCSWRCLLYTRHSWWNPEIKVGPLWGAHSLGKRGDGMAWKSCLFNITVTKSQLTWEEVGLTHWRTERVVFLPSLGKLVKIVPDEEERKCKKNIPGCKQVRHSHWEGL